MGSDNTHEINTLFKITHVYLGIPTRFLYIHNLSKHIDNLQSGKTRAIDIQHMGRRIGI